jgi:hypothetical protein
VITSVLVVGQLTMVLSVITSVLVVGQQTMIEVS